MLGMLGDKKKMITTILGEGPVKEKEVPRGLESDFNPAYEATARDLMEAFKSGNEKMFVSSMKNFLAMNQSESEYGDSESEEA